MWGLWRCPQHFAFVGTGPERMRDFPEVTGQIWQKQESELKCAIQGGEGLLCQSSNPLRSLGIHPTLPFQEPGSGRSSLGIPAS